MRHVTGNPDIVHTASDPAECACQRAVRVTVNVSASTTVNERSEDDGSTQPHGEGEPE